MSDTTQQHTPGPWHVSNNPSHHGEYIFNAAMAIARVERYSHSRQTEIDANAHLIAAAPELLEALHEIVDAYITECICRIPMKADADAVKDRLEDRPLMRQIRAAIAKATGAAAAQGTKE